MSKKHDVDRCTDEDCAICQRIIQFYNKMQDVGAATDMPLLRAHGELPEL